MDLNHTLSLLEGKDTSVAFQALKDLETLSDTSDSLYPHIKEFIAMTNSNKYVMRVRGFRLLCKQAKWDVDNVIDSHLDSVLTILNDEKPTAVRQALAALHDVVIHKKALRKELRQYLLMIDYLRYKDTMHSLIAQDIEALLKLIDNQ